MKNLNLLILMFFTSFCSVLAQGVELVEDITAGESGTFAPYIEADNGIIGVISGKVYSFTQQGSPDRIWVTDPSNNETNLVYGQGNIDFLTIFNDELYFQAWDNDGSQLMVIHADQTVEELYTSEDYIEDFTAFDGALYFSDDNFLMKYEEGNGVTMIYEFYSFGGILDMTATDQQLFIIGSIDGSRQLFTSDGTTEGTNYYFTMNVGSEFNTLTFMTPADNKVFFWFSQNDDTYRLWVTDGTEEGTLPLLAHNSIPFTDLIAEASITVYDGKLYYRGDTDEYGDDLYVSDGTLAGTKIFFEPFDGSTDSRPQYMLEHNGGLYFKIRNSSWNPIWFKTNGVEGDVERFLPTYKFLNTPMKIYNNQLLVSASEGHYLDKDIYVSDGTTEGTTALTSLSSDQHSFGPFDLTIVGDKIFFTGESEIYGRELFVFDPNLVGLRNEMTLNDLKFTAYPTVTTDEVTVIINEEDGTDFQLNLYNMNGKLVKQAHLQPSGADISLKELPAGMYLLKIKDVNGQIGSKRMIKM